jgi:hypothetical protein
VDRTAWVRLTLGAWCAAAALLNDVMRVGDEGIEKPALPELNLARYQLIPERSFGFIACSSSCRPRASSRHASGHRRGTWRRSAAKASGAIPGAEEALPSRCAPPVPRSHEPRTCRTIRPRAPNRRVSGTAGTGHQSAATECGAIPRAGPAKHAGASRWPPATPVTRTVCARRGRARTADRSCVRRRRHAAPNRVDGKR